jgi:hypothetical protein
MNNMQRKKIEVKKVMGGIAGLPDHSWGIFVDGKLEITGITTKKLALEEASDLRKILQREG